MVTNGGGGGGGSIGVEDWRVQTIGFVGYKDILHNAGNTANILQQL